MCPVFPTPGSAPVLYGLTATASRNRLWLVNSVILAIGLCQIHMQAVEYILGDQPLNFEQASDSLFNLY